jgi:DNA replication protein DnaC
MRAPANPPERFECARCGGDGFVLDPQGDAVPCECREVRVRRARTLGVSSVIPRKYRGVSFERAPVSDIDDRIIREVKRFVRDMDTTIPRGKGLWIFGDVGTGKTSLAMLVSKEAIQRGYSVAIYSVPRLLGHIRATYDSGGAEQSYASLFEQLASVDLLHLDDLGAEKQTDWVLEQLYSLVNERYERERSIVLTTNVELKALEEQIGERTVSRLTEMTEQVPLFGADLRQPFDSEQSALA